MRGGGLANDIPWARKEGLLRSWGGLPCPHTCGTRLSAHLARLTHTSQHLNLAHCLAVLHVHLHFHVVLMRLRTSKLRLGSHVTPNPLFTQT